MPIDDTNSSEVPRLLEQAKEGDEQALSALLQWSRGFLRVEARDTLGPQLRVRVDESDLVQKVCMAAIQELSQFRGASAGEYVLWLRRILERDILEVVEREQDAAKRAVDREGPIRPNSDGIQQLLRSSIARISAFPVRCQKSSK